VADDYDRDPRLPAGSGRIVGSDFPRRRSAGGAGAARALGDAHAGAGADHLAAERGGKAPDLPVLSMVDRRKAMHREMVEAHPDWPAIPHASVVEKMGLEQRLWPNLRRSAAMLAVENVLARAELMLGSGVWLTQATDDGWVKG
jgi:hypothetical protein